MRELDPGDHEAYVQCFVGRTPEYREEVVVQGSVQHDRWFLAVLYSIDQSGNLPRPVRVGRHSCAHDVRRSSCVGSCDRDAGVIAHDYPAIFQRHEGDKFARTRFSLRILRLGLIVKRKIWVRRVSGFCQHRRALELDAPKSRPRVLCQVSGRHPWTAGTRGAIGALMRLFCMPFPAASQRASPCWRCTATMEMDSRHGRARWLDRRADFCEVGIGNFRRWAGSLFANSLSATRRSLAATRRPAMLAAVVN